MNTSEELIKDMPYVQEVGAIRQPKKKDFLKGFNRWSIALLILVAGLQLLFFGTGDNYFAVGVVIVCWVMTTIFINRKSVFEKYTLSSFLILGFAITQYFFPLLFTIMEGKPIIYNLKLPHEVFLHAFLGLGVIIIAHVIYRQIYPHTLARFIKKTLFKSILFRSLPDKQTWIMGILGTVSMLYFSLHKYDGGQDASLGAGSKFIMAFMPFTYAPFYLPLKKLYSKEERVSKNLLIQLVIYTIVLFIVSIIRNSRGSFMFGFTSVGFGYFLGLLLNVYPPKFFNIRTILTGVFAIYMVMGPLSDLGTAMVIARAKRGTVSGGELFSTTLELFNDKEALRKYKLLTKISDDTSWDETYLNNIYLARFCNLKFNDLSLDKANVLGHEDHKFYEHSMKVLLANLPQPLLNVMGVKLEKTTVNTFSFGDMLYTRVEGENKVIAGFKTGHFAGTGMAAFGWWYLLYLGIVIIPVFFLIDQLVIKFSNIDSSTKIKSTVFVFSFCALLNLNSVFQFFPRESVVTIAAILFRVWFQLLVLYYVVFQFTKLITYITGGKR